MRWRVHPSDMTDEEWVVVEPLIPPGKVDDDKVWTCEKSSTRSSPSREVVAGGGCWPHAFPPWPTVWTYFRLYGPADTMQ